MLSLKLSRRLRRVGFTAKGAFALTFLLNSSFRGCLRVFLQARVRGYWNLNFLPYQKMKKRKKTMRTMKNLTLHLLEKQFGAVACQLSSGGGRQHEKAKPPQK